MVIFSLWNSFIKMAVTSYFIDLLVNKEPFEGKTEEIGLRKNKEEISFCSEERRSSSRISISISLSKGETEEDNTNKESKTIKRERREDCGYQLIKNLFIAFFLSFY